MIVDNSDFKISHYVPMWNSNGQKVLNCVALDASTKNYGGEVVPTSSGWGWLSVASMAATGGIKYGVSLEDGSSGEYIDVAIAGLCSGVNVGDTGDTAALSTFTKGDAVMLSDTGHLIRFGATFASEENSFSTAQTSGPACIGIALSSGETTSVDLLLVEKPFVHPDAT